MELKTTLPHIMAMINASTVITLLAGYRAIRSGDRERHRRCMYAAIGLGAVFLGLYLLYHLGAGLAKFGGVGVIRPIYFSILIVHILAAGLAAVVVPIAVVRALGGRFEQHRAIAARTWTLWLFVAVSGLVVYVMTIHIWPYAGV